MDAQVTLFEQLLAALRRAGVTSARSLGDTLGVSQPTVSRLLAQAGDQVVRLGQARRSRYAATRQVRGLGNRWPLYRIDAQGQARDLGALIALHNDGCLLQTGQLPTWLRGEFGEGLFPGLPWFLDDMRPQGFLGRMFARTHAAELGLNEDILRWSNDDVLAALLLRGEDGPGQFVLGERALEKALSAASAGLPVAERGIRYAELAERALSGPQAGSSAAGEQPKFTTCVIDADGSPRHVIVKFSEPVQGNPVGRRWADLLISEHLAANLLHEQRVASARTELVWSGDRLCLESTRFDRIGAHGRRGVVSLAAWSDAYDGVRDSWPDTASRMRREGWLAEDAVDDVTRLWWFGQLIANTDMHYGNLSFFLDDSLPLALCPSYDMLPMQYRPGASGNLPAAPLQARPPRPDVLASWQLAAAWAADYWQRVGEHAQISDAFRDIAAANHEQVELARQRFA
ncbi:type II toxin-antitoxin system HipA family toxin YjjJ [Dyella sp. LX-66]|uniref:type II toxin-antitoxin system HipA family toxin YjjJ n=1 Tax=unclassified Dyella TaxID=2634549 RepID=UPI001BE0B1D6|nr:MULTISPECIES: type II toxin-antitoxin system HipA family toxin YjjJ [unclassified Dyella]MBT2119247.1 type II toxin-antitoxin system HipA family toxin YjjJ [Dyella sp. LX-1]MBT2141618.1 type II toxin-antitoxin system HipA family toxin YjjJ [Dyella sp. LX-66]